MRLKVDLIPKGTIRIAQTNRLIKRMKLVAYALVACMIAAVAVLVLVRGGLEVRLAAVKREVAVVDEQLSELKDREMQLSYESLILSKVALIVSQRKDFRRIISDVYSLLTADTWVDALSFTDDGVLMTYKADGVGSYRKLDLVLSQLSGDKIDWLESVKINQVSRASNAVYSINVDMGIIKTKSGEAKK
ncbi:hypothetical protein A2368_02520 [Candidatus Collierbacteria bacterium RIFOXYB1_FULL_49_13]|uniref:Fimbrial assembly protein n=1 Tax=Candidatus Collierbacteria bacterium RIFOXYB1_FULL_49_13 TaxID=1817728 RepID=A0A1F5FJY3_9BACT|nr:MAG: hypothetical protein A2368_02520 [Candidatus Collierbacteria bacterium RIFOXYB1_FULL_49_13]